MVLTSFISSRFQSFLKQIFGWIGYHAHTHPLSYLCCGLLITILSGLGLMTFKFESDGIELYIPTDSEIYKQYEKTIDLFGEFSSTAHILVGNKNGQGLLSPQNLNNLYNIYSYPTFNLTSKHKGKDWSYNDLCQRPYPSFPQCNSEITSIFALFNNDPNLWQDQSIINAYILSDAGQEILAYFMGGLEYNGSRIINGSYLRIDWTLQSTSNNTIYDAIWEWLFEFQDYFGDEYQDFEKEYSYKITYFTSRSMDDEIGRLVASDGAVYLAAIVTMYIYLSFTLGSCTKIGARPYLAIITIFVMICALITGYGLGLLFGYPLSTIPFLIPYLLLGVGVDDEIIIVEAIDSTPYFEDDNSGGGERFEIALKHSGLSISLTSFCSVMAFAIGSNVTLPGVSGFCVFAALGFLANYILQFLIFVPLLALDERRKRANRNFCCPCYKHAIDESDTIGHPTPDTKAPAEEKENDNVEIDDDDGFKCGVSSVLQYGVLPIVTKQPLRIIIIIIFIGLFIGSILSLSSLDTTSDNKRLVPDDSFAIDYTESLEDAFPGETYSEITIVLQHLDFSDNDIRQGVHNIIDEYNIYDDGNGRIIGTVSNWLEDFELYVENNYQGNGTNMTGDEILDEMDQDEFYSTLKEFENDTVTHYAEWNEEIVYDNQANPTKVKATKFFMNFAKPDTTQEEWPMRNSLNRIIKNNVGSNNGYVFEMTYPFAYFENQVVVLTIENVLWASAGVFAVLILLMDMRMAVFIILIVIMIDLCLFGWIVITDLSLDNVAFLQLIMAVGLTVDYVIHITHAIADAHAPKGTDPKDVYNTKLRIAVLDMGVGVVKGAWTTFLGAIPLIFSQSEAFRRFSYLFFGIIIIALAHGIFFVPSIMAQLPFLWKGIEHAQDAADETVDPTFGKDRVSGQQEDVEPEPVTEPVTVTNTKETVDVEMHNSKNEV